MLYRLKNKTYKKTMLYTLFFLQGQLTLRAEFLSIKKDKIEASKLDVYRSELTKQAILIGSSCFMTAGIGTFLWRYFRAKPEIDQRFSNLFEKYNSLSEEDRKKIDEIFKGNDSNLTDNWRDTCLKFLKTGVPVFAFELGKTMAWGKLTEFINYSLPSGFNFSDRLFSDKTISWFIDHKTTLLNTITALNTVIDNVLIEQSLDKELFEVNYNMLVSQVEKILGFMLYNSNLLPKDAFAEKNRALIIQKRTVGILLEFLASIKKLFYIENLNLNANSSTQYNENTIDVVTCQDLKKILLKLVENIESFKEIDKSLGLQDKVNRNVFDNIKVSLLTIKDQNAQDETIDIGELQDLFKDMLNRATEQ